MKSFSVILFLKSNQVDFVPSKWINENQDKCRYPKTKHPDFDTIKLDADSNPPAGWTKYKIKIVGQSGEKLIIILSILHKPQYLNVTIV